MACPWPASRPRNVASGRTSPTIATPAASISLSVARRTSRRSPSNPVTVTGTRDSIGGRDGVGIAGGSCLPQLASDEHDAIGIERLAHRPTAPTRPSRPVAGVRRKTDSANPPMTTNTPTRATAIAQISGRLTRNPCDSSKSTYDPAIISASPVRVNRPNEGTKISAKKSTNAARMSSAPRHSKGSCESPIAASTRAPTPIAPGIEAPGLDSSRKRPRNPSTSNR